MKTAHKTVGLFCFVAVLLCSQAVQAGMPMPVLTRSGTDRLIGMSTALFILMVIVAIPIRLCWNALFVPIKTDENEPTAKPLSYPQALGVTFLGGCLFLLVLVMIAGSRELLSPGAWIPDGAMSKTLYSVERERIAQSTGTDGQRGIDLLRRDAVVRLRDALMLYIKEHDGRLPDSIEQSGFGDLWLIPFAAGIQYEYFPTETELPLVREPKTLPDNRFSIGRKFEITEVLP